ncbi:MAG: proton-conducting transporter membrane subunit [Desulfurococcaceae archaeon]|nr:hypothetical protein [Sulfolobales archaeon]MDW8169681.1 proton-conducting transporter membrane subunit [Desulfurococcaceae archaeon]
MQELLPLLPYVIAVIIIILSSIPQLKAAIYLKALGMFFIWISALLAYLHGAIDVHSMIFASSASLVGVLASTYTIEYSRALGYGAGLNYAIDAFSVLIFTSFIVPNVLLFIITWTIAELVGFYLVNLGQEHSIESSVSTSSRYLLVSTATFEMSAFTTIYVSLFTVPALVAVPGPDLSILLQPFAKIVPLNAPNYAIPLMLIGFITKSALIPLHFWLPDAHSVAPSPASALLSGAMVSMGTYGLLRISDMFKLGEWTPIALIVLGLLTTLYGGLQAYVQRDSKRLLAYSTLAGSGFSTSLLGYYLIDRSMIALIALYMSVISHSMYKATLFLDAGLIEIAYGYRLVHRVHGATKVLPISSLGGIMAFTALIGIPPTATFLSKLLALMLIVEKGLGLTESTLLISVAASISLSIIYGLAYVKMYFGKPSVLLTGSKTMVRKSSFSVLAAGVLNYLIPFTIVLFTTSTIIIASMALTIPIAAALIYSFYTIARRGVD